MQIVKITDYTKVRGTHILHWQMFWNTFESTIHHNTTLTELQKFSYLKEQLRMTATEAVEVLPLLKLTMLTQLNY